MVHGGTYAYVGQAASSIAVIKYSPETGEMAKIQEIELHDGVVGKGVRPGRYMSLALSPDRRFLFASNRTAPYYIRSYQVSGADGTLTHIADSPTAESSPYISTDRTGRYLFAVHNAPNRSRRIGMLSVSVISEQGVVLAPHQTHHIDPKGHCTRIDYTNRFLLASCCDGDTVWRFAFDANSGMMNPDGLGPLVVRKKSGPRHFVFHPNNRFMYMINEYDGAIYVYSLDPHTGAMSQVQLDNIRPPEFSPEVFLDKEDVDGPTRRTEFPEEPNPRSADLHLTPDGKWLYASARASSTLAVYAVDAATGRLTRTGDVQLEPEPRGFNIDPLGRYLLAANLLRDSLTTYQICNQTGDLSVVSTLEDIRRPNWVEFARLL